SPRSPRGRDRAGTAARSPSRANISRRPRHTRSDGTSLIYLDVKHIVVKMNSSDAPVPPSLWTALWRASRTVEEHARRRIEGLGICPSDYGILAALVATGPMAVSALGKRVLLTSGSMTTAIDRLEQKGLVRRKDDPADR